MVILIGYMGSGKSTLGKNLAEERQLDFLDLDDYIEMKEGMSVAEIFKNRGEIFFRKKERYYLEELLEKRPDVVLALGGGTPCFGDTMPLILNATKNVFYLKAGLPVLLKRLAPEKETRPLIKDISDSDLPEFIQKHLFERNFYYLQAHHIITVDEKAEQEIVKEIKALLV